MATRTRADRCPGLCRPWEADDGSLVRLRLVGGRVSPASLASLSGVAVEHGDGDVHLTARANLQVRGLPAPLTEAARSAVLATGLVPSPTHELVRNLMVSPLTGVRGGRADLRPVAAQLDALLCADAELAGLPGRFLFVLDDGRGDLLDRPLDLGLVALDGRRAQLRLGTRWWGPTVPLASAAAALVDLARGFLRVRGAAWHVDELEAPLLTPVGPDPLVPSASGALAFGPAHVPAPDGILAPALVADLVAYDEELVVTPWRGVVVPSLAVAA